MSNYPKIAREFNELCTQKFAAFIDAKTQFEESERRVNRFGNIPPTDYEKLAERARAIGTRTEKQGEFEKAKKALNADAEINALRRKLEKALDEEFCVKPSALERDVLYLLDSGILTGREFEILIDNALKENNYTMARLIGKKAAELAIQVTQDKDHALSKQLNAVRHKADIHAPKSFLKAFDELIDIYRRTAVNTSMLPRWDELTAPLFEVFKDE